MGEFTTLSGVRPQTARRPTTPIVDRTLVRPGEYTPQAAQAWPVLRSPAERPFIPPKPVTPGDMIGGRKVGSGEVVYTLSDMVKVAVKATDIPKAYMASESRAGPVVKARQIGMWLCKHFAGRSFNLIGRSFGGRDHSTAINAVKRVEAAIRASNIDVAMEPLAVARELWSVDWPRVPK